MKIRFVSGYQLSELKETYQSAGEALIVFGFGGLGEVNYEKELKGESGFFEEAALLSKRSESVVISGCITDTRGHKRKSAVVADNGRLCGVSDALYAIDGEVSAGASLRIYDTKAGKMGLAVAEDIRFPEVVKALTLCGSDFIVCPYGKITDTALQILLRAHAYCYGVPILFCGVGYCIAVDGTGNVVFATPQKDASFDFENKKQYHLVESRQRMFLKE